MSYENEYVDGIIPEEDLLPEEITEEALAKVINGECSAADATSD